MAQADYFLKIDGIEGESTDDKHKNEIDIESFSYGATNSGDAASRGGAGMGKVSMQDFHFVSKISKASPKLMEACATGKHIASATLTCRRAGGKQQEYLKIKLSDLIVSSYQHGGSGNSILPVDQFSLNYGKIEKEYTEQDDKGNDKGKIKTQYDLKKNKA
jgi:type VI secretion system secreted protein Hcp